MDKRKTILIGLLILIPQLIFANAGTALMWVQIYHLIFGNLVLGLIEGVLLRFMFKADLKRASIMMILSNYTSWIIGTILISLLQNTLIDKTFDLEYVYPAWIVSLILLYFLTVFVETGFIFWIFKKTVKFSRTILFSLAINTLTYIIMIAFYLLSSGFNVFTDLEIDQSILSNRTEKHVFYLLNRSDKTVSKYSLDSQLISNHAEFKSDNKYPVLKLEADSIDKKVRLVVDLRDSNTITLDTAFCQLNDTTYYGDFTGNYWLNAMTDFRLPEDRTWTAHGGDWAIQGLRIRENNELIDKYAFEVPWMYWGVSDVSILNNHELIFNLNGRVVLLDIEAKKIAFLFKASDYQIKRIEE
ncbi:hypothetical protein [Mariniphaga sediminis]|uniref:hypothetical protein n=1 Tax=Mariniphaga sediminis TaxID=1628158 RepID=UPI00356430F6